MVEFEKLISGESCKGNFFGKFWVVNVELFNGEEVFKEWVGLIDVEDGS